MSTLHVVHRVDGEGTIDEQWSVYSFPVSMHTAGRSLAAARSAFHELADDFLGADALDKPTVVEHIEHPLYEGAYMRVAIDRRTLDRQEAADGFRTSLSTGANARRYRNAFEENVPTSASGDLIVVACVGSDPINWVLDQMAPEDAVAVCLLGPQAVRDQLISWSYLVRENAELDPVSAQNVESLADAALSVTSTVGELIRANAGSDRARGLLVAAAS